MAYRAVLLVPAFVVGILRVLEWEVMEDGEDVVRFHMLDKAGSGVQIWQKQVEKMSGMFAVFGHSRC